MINIIIIITGDSVSFVIVLFIHKVVGSERKGNEEALRLFRNEVHEEVDKSNKWKPRVLEVHDRRSS
jgi:hypothetical protein